VAVPALAQAPVVGSASGTSVNATFGSANTAGNYIIAFGRINGLGATFGFSDPTNGTYWKLVTGSSGSNSLAIAITPVPIVGSAAVTVTMTSSANTTINVTIHEWSGLDSTNPIFLLDQVLAVTSGTSATPSAGTFATLAEAGELCLVFSTTGATSSTWTAGTGFTLDGSSNPSSRQVEYQVAPSTAGPTAQFGIDASRAWTACGVALRAARTRKVLSITSGTTFPTPSDWPGTADRVDVIGGGAAGNSAVPATFEGQGGGGGAYTFAYNVSIAAGAAIQVGAGGSTDGQAGTDTWVVSSATVLAKGGGAPTVGGGGAGGAAASCIPSANAKSGGAGGNNGSGTNGAGSGATGGGGAGGPFGAGAKGGDQNGTGTTGGAGGGAGGGGSVGVVQTASNQAGTNGGNAFGPTGAQASTGGTGGASGANPGTAGSNGGTVNSGAGGGGGGSDGAGGGGAGGSGGNGAEFAVGGGIYVGSGGGGAGNGNITSGSTPTPGNGGLYGAGGGGGGNGTFSAFGRGGGGLIFIVYQPAAAVSTAGGTGRPARRAKIKRSKEIFQEEMAALEAQLAQASEDREEIESTLTAAESSTAHTFDAREMIAAHERAFRKDAALARIPVYIRIPKKPVGANRVEAINRLRILAHAARYRESVASEKLRKIKEKIDTDAAVAFMQWALRDWD
jgi:hypothetical protein